MEGNPILRRVVYLHEISEMTTGKTAEVLTVAEGTVKARVFRARRNLYRDLSERLGIHGRKARPTPLDVQEMNVTKCERPRLLVRPDPGES